MSTPTIERLQELLDEKDEQLRHLQEDLDETNEKLRIAKRDHSWCFHEDVVGEDPRPQLPLPRLELQTIFPEHQHEEVRVLYRLVYRHFTGRWRMDGTSTEPDNKDHIIFVPLGETRIGGPHNKSDVYGSFPFRDGAHIKFDSIQFRMPAFVIGPRGHVETLEEACKRDGHEADPWGARKAQRQEA